MKSTIKNLYSLTSSANSPASKGEIFQPDFMAKVSGTLRSDVETLILERIGVVLDALQNGTIESGQRLNSDTLRAARTPILTTRSHPLRHCGRLSVKLLTHNGKTHAKHLPTAWEIQYGQIYIFQVISNCVQVIHWMCCSILTDRIARLTLSKAARASVQPLECAQTTSILMLRIRRLLRVIQYAQNCMSKQFCKCGELVCSLYCHILTSRISRVDILKIRLLTHSSRTGAALSPAASGDLVQTIWYIQVVFKFAKVAYSVRCQILIVRISEADILKSGLLSRNTKTHSAYSLTALDDSVWSMYYIQVVLNYAEVGDSLCCYILLFRIARQTPGEATPNQ
ncbi:hypothetical protein MIR68_000358 [Amoeboaphelidium protococcarum]|nr:hypothetical protein MIR68_000358 [Amoeboaphelidium protococcarum]